MFNDEFVDLFNRVGIPNLHAETVDDLSVTA